MENVALPAFCLKERRTGKVKHLFMSLSSSSSSLLHTPPTQPTTDPNTDLTSLWSIISAPLPKICLRRRPVQSSNKRKREEGFRGDGHEQRAEQASQQSRGLDNDRGSEESDGLPLSGFGGMLQRNSIIAAIEKKPRGKKRRIGNGDEVQKKVDSNVTAGASFSTDGSVAVLLQTSSDGCFREMQHVTNAKTATTAVSSSTLLPQSPPKSNTPKRSSKKNANNKKSKVKRQHSKTHNKKSAPKQREPPACIFFMKGHCHKGASCEFRHQGVTVNKFHTIPCQFFLQGICRKRADECGYSHDISKCPCKFFHLYGGKCSKGTSCTWRHGEITADELQSLREQHEGDTVSKEKQHQEAKLQEAQRPSLFEEMLASQTNMFGGL